MKTFYEYRNYIIKREKIGFYKANWVFSFTPLARINHKTLKQAKAYIDKYYDSQEAIRWREIMK